MLKDDYGVEDLEVLILELYDDICLIEDGFWSVKTKDRLNKFFERTIKKHV